MVIEDKDTINIIVNMAEKVVNVDDLSSDGQISFDQVLELAREVDEIPSGPYIEYEIYYDNAISRPPDARLYPEKSVKIQNGTSFNVTYTDKS